MEVERREKTVGYVTRGAVSEGGVGVEVTVEVGSARVKAIVRDDVERQEKILRCVSREEEFEDVRIYVRGFTVTFGMVDDRTADSAPS